MTITADSSRSVLRYVEESTIGTTPASALTQVRQTANDLARTQSYETSQAIRSDRNIIDSVLVDAEIAGTYNFELSYGDHDDFLAGALFNTWSTTKAVSGTDISAANADNSYNSTSTDFTTENISVGDWIKVAAFTNTANNGYAKVVSVATSKLVVSNLTLTTESSGNTITMTGASLKNGTTVKSFTFENEFSDITQFISYTGCVVSSMDLSYAVGSILTGTFNFVGMDSAIAATTVGTGSALASSTNNIMNSVNDVVNIREGDVLMSSVGVYLLSASMNLDNGVRGQKALGVLGNIGIGTGRSNATGTLEIYFKNADIYNKFLNNTSTSIDLRVSDGTNTYIIDMPKLKFTGNALTVSGIDTDIVMSLDFQSLYDSVDGSSFSIHRFA